jgi:glutamine synthetase
VIGLKDIYGAAHKKLSDGQLSIIEQIAEHIAAIKSLTDKMTDARRSANKLKDIDKKAFAYCDNVKPYFEQIRNHSDKLESLMDNNLWPLTKYRELLFQK